MQNFLNSRTSLLQHELYFWYEFALGSKHCLFGLFSYETHQAVALCPAGSSAERSSPTCLHLYREEHPVECLFPELWHWGLHTSFQPEPSLQAANGNPTL